MYVNECQNKRLELMATLAETIHNIDNATLSNKSSQLTKNTIEIKINNTSKAIQADKFQAFLYGFEASKRILESRG